MSSFKSPELVLDGKIVKATDSNINEVDSHLYRSVAYTQGPASLREKTGSSYQAILSLKPLNHKPSME